MISRLVRSIDDPGLVAHEELEEFQKEQDHQKKTNDVAQDSDQLVIELKDVGQEGNQGAAGEQGA